MQSIKFNATSLFAVTSIMMYGQRGEGEVLTLCWNLKLSLTFLYIYLHNFWTFILYCI